MRHKHEWVRQPITMELRKGAVMVVCSCGAVGWEV